MRIGIDIRPLLSGVRTGVGEYTYELLQAVFSLGTDHEFFLFSNAYKRAEAGVFLDWEKHPNVRAASRRIPNKLLHGSIAATQRPRIDRLTAEHLDVFFSPNIHFTAIGTKTKHVLTVHDLSFEHFSDCYSRRRRTWHRLVHPKKQCEGADMILTPSEHTKQDIIQTYGIDAKKIHTVYPGLSQLFFTGVPLGAKDVRQRYTLPKKYILYLGTIEPRKNIGALIDAFVLSDLKRQGYTLIIAGAEGWNAGSIMRMIQQTEGVRSIGYVDAADKPNLYRSADLFVYPSLYEGFGFPVLEAMASDTPVITSNRSSLPEVVGAGAMLVNPLNTHEIADAMTTVLSDGSLQKVYTRRGKERAAMFNWNQSARSLLQLFESL